MIPPNQATQQALMLQRGMQQPQDPLMQALSRQAMMGDMMKQVATHKMKMLKLKQKYVGQMGQPMNAPMQGGY